MNLILCNVQASNFSDIVVSSQDISRSLTDVEFVTQRCAEQG